MGVIPQFNSVVLAALLHICALGIMSLRQVPLPDSPACSARLEAKLDSLAQKLDAHLLAKAAGRTGGCPACLTCCKHDEKHQEMHRRLEAQADLLDRLDKRTVEMLGLLGRLVQKGIESPSEFHVCCPY